MLIANRHSLISAGTETASVKRNIKDMVVKAVKDPEIRDGLKEMIFKDGIRKTVDRVQFETTKWTAMGYSGAGIAVAVGDDIDGIVVGDLVAYGGQGHAEYVRATKNLCVKIPQDVTTNEAAYVAVGSIALQAVRRANVNVGDVVAVLGLGLVGQLVSQLLQAAGARVIGSDVISQRLDMATSLGLEHGFLASETLPEEIKRYTNGVGADNVVICASTSSPQVIQQAIAIARDRGQITVVGMVNLDVPCEDFYMKELDLVVSRSYGPGRYDVQYEEQGVDYPLSYVRWTEHRNMAEFLRLIAAKKVNVAALTSQEFDVSQASQAYDLLMASPADNLGVLLKYDSPLEVPEPTVALKKSNPVVRVLKKKTQANIAVVGCGGFARQFHLPNIKASPQLNLLSLVTSTGQSAKEMGLRYGADYCTTDYNEMLRDPNVDAVMIFTRDNAHAPMVVEAIKAGKHVFCEKPLATSLKQCDEIASVCHDDGPVCMVGFNRRFAPLMIQAKQVLDQCSGPLMMHYRVNAGTLPSGNWVYDPKSAAGRIVGEACHFIDLMTWLIGSKPVDVFAQPLGESASLSALENMSATFTFADGSVGTLLYTAVGSRGLSKERLEVFTDGTALVMDDFQRLTVRGKKNLDVKNRAGDKGHDAELQHFTDVILGRTPLELTHWDGILGTACCLRAYESIRDRTRVNIVPAEDA